MSKRAAWLLLAALVLPAGPSRAADTDADEARLRDRLAPEIAQQVLAIAREARRAGLPAEPLVGRALEGASRHVDAAEILADLRRQSAALAAAREALGALSNTGEIIAGAGALSAGVPADSLARMRVARPAVSLVVPLVVLCDFVARGVPPDAAAAAVLTASRAGASDEALMRMRERIHDRIARGGAPAGATREVLRQWLRGAPGSAPGAAAKPPVAPGGRTP